MRKEWAVAFLVMVFGLLSTLTVTSAQEIPDALHKKLAEYKGAERGQLAAVADEALAREFSGYSFYVLRFRLYPVAIKPPEPLGSNNLFVVKPDGSVDYVPEAEALERFFRKRLPPVKSEAAAKLAARAWLRLLEEFHQDGFTRFSIPEDSLRVARTGDGGLEASAKAVVTPQAGDTGEISASLSFDSAGGLVDISEAGGINRGMRPICQATKLLDPDPIVRGMAEQSILVMGSAAKEYLYEQRAKASPDLQRAIDRIWQRIVVERR